jgi:proteasome lid subunit RPN8/RPN11
MRRTLTILGEHEAALSRLVFPKSGHEGAALLLCGTASIDNDPWEGDQGHRKYLSHAVVPIDPDDRLGASESHVRSRTGSFAKLLKRARDENLVASFVHSHPSGYPKFSQQDDADEALLVQMAQNRNGRKAELLSLVLVPQGAFGRVWLSPDESQPLDAIRVIGERFRFYNTEIKAQALTDMHHRQALAFGKALNADLGQLRVGVVGAGATGSAVSMLLPRLGVRRLLLVDADIVETSNLSRLHGATSADAAAGRPKVDVLRRVLDALGLDVSVAVIQKWASAPECRDALKACDIVFGCTDDSDGRLLLNRLSYFYGIPIIDMGIRIDPSDDEPRRIREAAGRVTVLQPGERCLICRGVVRLEDARDDQLARADPNEFARQQKEGYVRGGGPDPAVVTFTTDVACMAVDELIHRLTGYRRCGSIAHRVRKYNLGEDKRPGAKDVQCPLCVSDGYWGRGDVEPFLDRVG